MSFGGHILDMIKRTNANNALREKYRSKKDKKTKSLYKLENDSPLIDKSKSISKEELEKIKSDIRHKLIKERQKEAILIGCLSILSFLLLYCFLYLFFKN
ncbi:hypothetical protein ACI75Y_05065 [Capnocytophaga stomatis]|nr:hypothetical protein [Capnocytophaga stomatis]